MPVAALTTLGCKVNQYETERIAEDFASAGFVLTDFDAPADVYIINSCSVTAAADKKSRYLARKASRTNPNAVVVMTGCHSQQVLDHGEWVEGATLLIDNEDKMRIFAKVLEHAPEILSYSSSPATVLPARERRTRATLKVQDGCTHFCGFCQIPFTRKVKASRHWEEIVAETHALAESGTREIIVTGVCVGAYDEGTGSGGPDLAQLLLKVAAVPGIARVRLSSIQPIEVSDALIEAFASHPNLCPHLHLSCQSGDDTILRAMNRPYDAAFYKELVRKLRVAVPDVAITTDLIVGYPGESEVLHQNTLAFAREIGFQKTHCFRYSPRDKTYGATLKDDVSDEEKKQRHAELQTVVDASNRAFTERYLGQTLSVLVEHPEGGTLTGFTTNYIKVRFSGPVALYGALVPVRLDAVENDGSALGTLVLPDPELARMLAHAPRPKFQSLAMATERF
ncbi:tRNA (N(6)-L-threonylcarbamoyladenosine(37)-C(2))-methylthiotransferase MtaB [Armatimonas sp.]|uniref:tRNA (N(6)-L-threonylcarbamoyladenosine(37)-C(2))- methylthiotransferase MtaB n=1 Tax=Armatimonas sp. TaxID=1872638 RepID=UPI0037528A70